MVFTNTPSGEGALTANHPSNHPAGIAKPHTWPGNNAKARSTAKRGGSAQAASVEENIPKVGRAGQSNSSASVILFNAP
jgi:hypothetical protein